MADLSPLGRMDPNADRGARRGGRERGQIILVGAFALAVSLIALALVMNAAIYTENLATRSESAGTADAHTYQRTTAALAADAFEYAHEVNDGDHAALEASVRDAVETYHNVTRTQQAASGQVVNVSVASTVPGTNVTETDSSFESPGGAGNWTVATDVNQTRAFRLDVENWNGPDDRELRVVAGSVGTWYLNVSADGTDYEVGVNESGTYTTCATPPTDDITVNFSAGTVNGNDCAALDMDGVSGPYALKFENGSVANGDFTVVVDGSPSAALAADQHDHALYSMEVELVYWTPELRYSSTNRVAPGESDG